MKRLVLLLALLFGVPAFAQTTSVSGTIVDAGAQAWANGSVTFTFRPANSNPTGQYFQGGVPFDKNTTIGPLALDNTGSFSGVAVPDNNTITPSGSTFNVKVCPAATTSCVTVALTITGATQNISAQIVPSAVHLDLSVPLLGARAYTDPEVFGAVPGTMYFNLTDNRIHVCLQTGFPPCTWFVLNGGGGTVTSVSDFSPLFTTSTRTTTPTFNAISQAQNLVFASPNGSSGVPTFRALVSSDLPGGGGVNSVSGTPNQIASTGGNNPVLSLTSPVLTPGGLFVPASFGLGFAGLMRFTTTSGSDINCADSGGGACLFTLGSAAAGNPAIKKNSANLEVVLADGSNTRTGVLAANFTDAALTSGRCVQAGASGILTNAAGACANGTGFTQISTGTLGGASCSPGVNSFDTCTSVITISPTQADTNYRPQCNGVTPSNPRLLIAWTAATSTSTVTATVISEGSTGGAESFANISCTAIHP
jgi:hypothetical protein